MHNYLCCKPIGVIDFWSFTQNRVIQMATLTLLEQQKSYNSSTASVFLSCCFHFYLQTSSLDRGNAVSPDVNQISRFKKRRRTLTGMFSKKVDSPYNSPHLSNSSAAAKRKSLSSPKVFLNHYLVTKWAVMTIVVSRYWERSPTPSHFHNWGGNLQAAHLTWWRKRKDAISGCSLIPGPSSPPPLL